MPELAANDPIITNYIRDLKHLKEHEVSHELGLKGPFQTLLDKASKRRGWTLVPELSTYSGGKRVVPDGTVRDEYRLARGWWEAKDAGDKLGIEIQKKLKAGYPASNIIFEDTNVGVLYQDRGEAGEFALTEPVKVAELLNRFFSHDQTDYQEFERAMDEFKNSIPDLARSLGEHITEAHKKNKHFKVLTGFSPGIDFLLLQSLAARAVSLSIPGISRHRCKTINSFGSIENFGVIPLQEVGDKTKAKSLAYRPLG